MNSVNCLCTRKNWITWRGNKPNGVQFIFFKHHFQYISFSVVNGRAFVNDHVALNNKSKRWRKFCLNRGLLQHDKCAVLQKVKNWIRITPFCPSPPLSLQHGQSIRLQTPNDLVQHVLSWENRNLAEEILNITPVADHISSGNLSRYVKKSR